MQGARSPDQATVALHQNNSNRVSDVELSESERKAWEEYEIIYAALHGIVKKFMWSSEGESVHFRPNDRIYYSEVLGRENWPNPFIRPLKVTDTSDEAVK